MWDLSLQLPCTPLAPLDDGRGFRFHSTIWIMQRVNSHNVTGALPLPVRKWVQASTYLHLFMSSFLPRQCCPVPTVRLSQAAAMREPSGEAATTATSPAPVGAYVSAARQLPWTTWQPKGQGSSAQHNVYGRWPALRKLASVASTHACTRQIACYDASRDRIYQHARPRHVACLHFYLCARVIAHLPSVEQRPG